MSKNTYNNSSVPRATTAMLLAFGLVCCLSITPNLSAQTQSKPAKSRAAQPETSPGRSQQEGIKVHGHWTIEVRNPDGTLVTHREFENALTVPGAESLGVFLSRQSRPGLWSIFLTSPSSDPWGGHGANIFEPAEMNPQGDVVSAGGFVFMNLMVFPAAVGQSFGVQLSGSATAGNDGSIAVVNTRLQRSNDLVFRGFTAATLATPVNVSQGQFVQVIVTIGFS